MQKPRFSFGFFDDFRSPEGIGIDEMSEKNGARILSTRGSIADTQLTLIFNRSRAVRRAG